MSDQKQKLGEWTRFVKQSQTSYRMNALKAVQENDGDEMLKAVLKELGWVMTFDFMKQSEAPEHR